MTTVDDLFDTGKKKQETVDVAETATGDATPKKRPTSGKFAVLKQVGEGDSASFIIVEESVEAPNRETAIRSVAVSDDSVIEGSYVAVPLASWKIMQIKQTVKVSLF